MQEVAKLSKMHLVEVLFLGGIIINVVLISLINPISIINFFIFLVLGALLCRILFKSLNDIKKYIMLFVFYSQLAILLYLTQYITLPEYMGFSGPRGIGTDDRTFFIGATAPQSPWSHYSFSTILRIVARCLPVYQVDLLDLLFFNVLGLSFIPLFTSRVAHLLTNDNKVAKLAYRFSMFCPIIMANGLVLIRDGWTALLFIASLYFFLENKYFLFIGTTILLFYLRPASGVQFLVAAALFIYLRIRESVHYGYGRNFIAVLILLVSFITLVVILFPYIETYAVQKGIIENGSIILFRRNYIETFVKEEVESRGEFSALYFLYNQPWYIRISLGFLFFWGAPFFSVSQWFFNGMVIPRSILSQLFALLFLFYSRYFIQAVFYLCKNRNLKMRVVLIIFLFLLIIVSQSSIQVRHKTMLMPIFYVITAYGALYKEKIGTRLGIIASITLFCIEAIYNFIKLL